MATAVPFESFCKTALEVEVSEYTGAESAFTVGASAGRAEGAAPSIIEQQTANVRIYSGS
jgi:hypothetical protein